MRHAEQEQGAGEPASALPGGQAESRTDLAWHLVLLRMAGVLSDDLLSEARTWLAEGQLVDVAQGLAFAAAAARIPLLKADVALIAAELSAAGEDAGVVKDLAVSIESGETRDVWSFSATAIVEEPGSSAPALLDLTDPSEAAGLDETDRAAVAAVAGMRGEDDVVGLWRSWRTPADGASWPQPRRVYIVSMAAPRAISPAAGAARGPAALTGRLQQALWAAGEIDPQVEVCPQELPVPDYQRLACSRSALLWSPEPAVPIQLARVFDAVDAEQGPSFDQDHPIIHDRYEIDRLLDYLDGAQPVVTTSLAMADILDPARPAVVPLTFRTDGEWIWTDTVSYYLERYSLAPEEGLLAHLRSAPGFPSPLSDVARHRALAFLQRPDDAAPVWVVSNSEPS